ILKSMMSWDLLNVRNWKLVNKLLLSFLLVAIPPLFLLAYIQYQESTKYLLAMEERSLSFHAKIIAEQVDLYQSVMKNHLLYLAHNSRIVDFLSTPHGTDQEWVWTSSRFVPSPRFRSIGYFALCSPSSIF
ncbi:MAG: hypothetical protein N2442_14485, partial [Spirochaetes bacterium]|nr:hypothetical protein [Spirochaetota bacterium]